MGLTFNLLLRDVGIDAADVRLLRHETKKHRSRTPYSIWRREPASLERYQSTQERSGRSWFRSRYWASFVVTPDGKTLFVGLYEVGDVGPVPTGWTHELNDLPLDPAIEDLYDVANTGLLVDYAGRLIVDWGPGTRSWRQLAINQDKPIIELRQQLVDPPYPGHADLIVQLSDIAALPLGWEAALSAVQGVYLLTCPRTREQYVGSATGDQGFLGRWHEYLDGSDGGNLGLRSREPSDYQVSILQVAGSVDGRDKILAMEELWKRKLQSRAMGLNRN